MAKFKARYLGDKAHADWLALGDTKEEIEQRAIEAGINPVNLQWEDFTPTPQEQSGYQFLPLLEQPAPKGLEQIPSPADIPKYKEPEGGWVYEGEKMFGIPPVPEPTPETPKEIDIPDVLSPTDFKSTALDLTERQSQILETRQAQQQTLQSLIENIQKGFQSPTMEKSYVEQYNDLLAQTGIEDLRTRLIDTQDQLRQKQLEIRGEELTLQERMAAIEDKPVVEGIITGEKYAAEKQRELSRSREQLELQTLALEEQALSSRIQAEQSTIETIMNLTKMDYEQVRDEVETSYRRNLDIVNMTSQIYDRDYQAMQDALGFMSTQEQFKYRVQEDTKQNNRALLQTTLNAIQSRNISWQDLSPEDRERVSALSIASGYPADIGQMLIVETPKERSIQSQYFNQNTGQLVVTYDDGQVELKNIGGYITKPTGGTTSGATSGVSGTDTDRYTGIIEREGQEDFKFNMRNANDLAEVIKMGVSPATLRAQLDNFGELNVDTKNRLIEDAEKIAAESQPEETFLDEDYIRNLYNEKRLKEIAKDKGYTRGGFLGIGVGEEGINDLLKAIMDRIEAYRKMGISDSEINASLNQLINEL
jgi:hypothetical protein